MSASRFDPENDALRKSLTWHAEVTTELQRRILAATTYARGKSDHQMLAILAGDGESS